MPTPLNIMPTGRFQTWKADPVNQYIVPEEVEYAINPHQQYALTPQLQRAGGQSDFMAAWPWHNALLYNLKTLKVDFSLSHSEAPSVVFSGSNTYAFHDGGQRYVVDVLEELVTQSDIQMAGTFPTEYEERHVTLELLFTLYRPTQMTVRDDEAPGTRWALPGFLCSIVIDGFIDNEGPPGYAQTDILAEKYLGFHVPYDSGIPTPRTLSDPEFAEGFTLLGFPLPSCDVEGTGGTIEGTITFTAEETFGPGEWGYTIP